MFEVLRGSTPYSTEHVATSSVLHNVTKQGIDFRLGYEERSECFASVS